MAGSTGNPVEASALSTFVPRRAPDAMGMSRGRQQGLAENGRRGYTGAVRKFNYGDPIPLEAERAVKTSRAYTARR